MNYETFVVIILQINYEKIVVGRGKTLVGSRIKEYLKSHGIKMSFVAEKIGVTSSRMAQILNGKTIDCVVYYKICTTLSVPFEKFLKEA